MVAKVDDIFDTHLFGDFNPKKFLQTLNLSTSMTLHASATSIHVGVDYRDILSAYSQEWFQKIYMGSKVLFESLIGLAVGFYQGNLTYGVELNLFFSRLGLSYYTEERGEHIGVRQRSAYVLSIATGMDF